MIKAEIKERYIQPGSSREDALQEKIHDVRYFSSLEKFQTWYSTFKEQLWKDDEDKVNMVEGIFVVTTEVAIDDLTPPKTLRQHATFQPGISYYYNKQASA